MEGEGGVRVGVGGVIIYGRCCVIGPGVIAELYAFVFVHRLTGWRSRSSGFYFTV